MNILSELDSLRNTPDTEPEAFPFIPLEGEHISKAQIASDLGPRVGKYLTKGSRAFIVGNDGFNVTADDYPWLNLLTQWLQEGCDISYLLLNPSEKAFDLLRPVAEKSPLGRLAVFKINHRPKPNESVADYLDQWEKFHFVVFENPKQLWVESCHERGQTTASDCYYLNPKIAEETPLLDICKSRFDLVVGNYCKRVI